jgi:hypothetical protein
MINVIVSLFNYALPCLTLPYLDLSLFRRNPLVVFHQLTPRPRNLRSFSDSFYSFLPSSSTFVLKSFFFACLPFYSLCLVTAVYALLSTHCWLLSTLPVWLAPQPSGVLVTCPLAGPFGWLPGCLRDALTKPNQSGKFSRCCCCCEIHPSLMSPLTPPASSSRPTSS